MLSPTPSAQLLAANAAARQQGVCAGQTELEARVLCPGLRTHVQSPEAEMQAHAWLDEQWTEVTPRVQALSSASMFCVDGILQRQGKVVHVRVESLRALDFDHPESIALLRLLSHDFH